MQVEHKAVRYLRLRVRRDGDVRVSAPLRAGRGEVEAFLHDRAGWIRAQQERLATSCTLPAFQLQAGERLPFDGSALALLRHEGRPACWREGHGLHLRIPAGSDLAARRKLLLGWYRRELAADLGARVPFWAAHMGLRLPEWRIRNMHSRWGSCNPRARRISMALRLMGQPASCRDYVLVHELAHLRVAAHSAAFWAEVEAAMPAWRTPHDALRAVDGEAGLWASASA